MMRLYRKRADDQGHKNRKAEVAKSFCSIATTPLTLSKAIQFLAYIVEQRGQSGPGAIPAVGCSCRKLTVLGTLPQPAKASQICYLLLARKLNRPDAVLGLWGPRTLSFSIG